jgi:hypothetical protein
MAETWVVLALRELEALDRELAQSWEDGLDEALAEVRGRLDVEST